MGIYLRAFKANWKQSTAHSRISKREWETQRSAPSFRANDRHSDRITGYSHEGRSFAVKRTTILCNTHLCTSPSTFLRYMHTSLSGYSRVFVCRLCIRPFSRQTQFCKNEPPGWPLARYVVVATWWASNRWRERGDVREACGRHYWENVFGRESCKKQRNSREFGDFWLFAKFVVPYPRCTMPHSSMTHLPPT